MGLAEAARARGKKDQALQHYKAYLDILPSGGESAVARRWIEQLEGQDTNRAKRILRAAIAPLLPEITPGYDILLIARRPILKVKSTQVHQALRKSLQKLLPA